MPGIPKEMTSEELRKLQLLELDILKEVDRICRKNQIKYSICGGTLLGAVRHKGFIPWDDDIDVVMLREDYDRFFAVCKEELNAKYYAQSLETDRLYRWAYGRILLNGTSFVRCGQEHLKAQTGVFIDIIPCDTLSDHLFIREVQRGLAFIMRKMLYAPVGKVRMKGTMKGFGFAFLSLFGRKIPEMLLKLICSLSSSQNTEYLEYYGLMTLREDTKLKIGKKAFRKKRKQLNRNSSLRERILYDYGVAAIKREWFSKTEDIWFEDFYAKTIADYDGWLTFEYGDYMELPPVESRVPQQTVSSFSFGDYKCQTVRRKGS